MFRPTTNDHRNTSHRPNSQTDTFTHRLSKSQHTAARPPPPTHTQDSLLSHTHTELIATPHTPHTSQTTSTHLLHTHHIYTHTHNIHLPHILYTPYTHITHTQHTSTTHTTHILHTHHTHTHTPHLHLTHHTHPRHSHLPLVRGGGMGYMLRVRTGPECPCPEDNLKELT